MPAGDTGKTTLTLWPWSQRDFLKDYCFSYKTCWTNRTYTSNTLKIGKKLLTFSYFTTIMPSKPEFFPEELTILEKSPLSSAYAETFVFTPSNNAEDNLGSLFIVAEVVSNKTKKENAALIAELAGTLKSEYYKNTIVTPLSALKFSLKKTNNTLNQKKYWLNPQINLKIKLAVAALKTGTLHLARLGETSALILRNNSLETITPISPVSPVPPLAFDNIISGELMAEDKIVIATNQIHRISEDDLIYQLKRRELAKYLKRSNEGIKNLALVALYPKKNYTPTLISSNTPQPYLIEKPKTDKSYMTNKTYTRPVILISILLATITAFILVAVKIKNETARNKIEAETLLQEVTATKEKIIALLEVKNETEAGELLLSAEQKLERLRELKLFKTSRATLEADLEKITEGLAHLENISIIRKVIDLENNATGFDPLDLALGRNKILTFSGRTLYRFDLNRKSGNFESLEEGTNLITSLEKPDDPNIFLLATSDKIIQKPALADVGENKIIWTRLENAPALKKIALYGEAFYFLNEAGLISKLPYNISSTSPDLIVGNLELWSKSIAVFDFAIEGSIFGLTNEHTLVEMVNGEKKKEIKLRESIAKIFTSANHKNIYALAPTEGLIVVLDKELNIKKRHSHSELRGAKSFVVNSQERIVYFLKGKTVYSFEI